MPDSTRRRAPPAGCPDQTQQEPGRVASALARPRRAAPRGIAMTALAAGESVAAGRLQPDSPVTAAAGPASAVSLWDGTTISFSRITPDAALEPA